MNADRYAEIIHTRINHVQNLVSAISGLEITVLSVFFAQTNPINNHFLANKLIAICAYGVIFWMHIFTLYQFYSVKKAVLVLSSLERQMIDYSGIKYFDTGNLRLYLYFVAHGIPSIIAFVVPLGLNVLGIISNMETLILLISFLVVTVIVIWLLSYSFRLKQ